MSLLDRFRGPNQIPLYEDDSLDTLDEWQSSDALSFVGKNYALSAATAPFEVAATLVCVQYRGESENAAGKTADASEAAVGEIVASSPMTPDSDSGYLPPLRAGILEPIRQILEYEQFGYLSLLRGHVETFLYNALYNVIQPNLEELLLDFLDVFEDTDPGVNIATNTLVGGILGPLELARTRLIVQATHTKQTKYHGFLHCMSIIAAEEGGIPALYSPRHFIPTLLVSALRPALRLFSNHMITETLNINTTFNPILYRICQAGLLAVETAVLAPLELGRRRLMAQPVPHRRRRLIPVTENVAAQEKISDPSYPTVVKMPVQPYAGILDVWLRVTREEGGQGTGVFGTAKSFWKGYAGLYKGFWPMFATAFVRMVVEEAEKVNSEYAFSWSG